MDEVGRASTVRKELMETPGIPTTRWFDAVLLPKDQIDQPSQRQGAWSFLGHGGNTVTRMPEMVKGLEKLELLVVADPHPTTFAVVSERQGRHLSAADLHPVRDRRARAPPPTARCNGASRWSSRSSRSKDDYEVMYLLAKKLGFADQMFKNIKVDETTAGASRTSCARSTAAAGRTGYTGQSPERLKLHMANQDDFDITTLRAPKARRVDGEYYGLPWPCWGTPEMKHPGTPILYDTDLHVKEGGGTFRARFGVERNGADPAGRGLLLRRARRSRTAIPSSPWRC